MKFLVFALLGLSLSSFAYDLPLSKLERPEDGIIPQTEKSEDAIIQGLTTAILSKIVDVRDAHPKAHACVDDSVFTVEENLSSEYQTGLFAKPGSKYSAIVRFSSGSSDPSADDRERGPQGMAVKFLLPEELSKQVADIPGEKYFVAPQFYKTFDIITINAVREWLVNDLASYGYFFNAVGKVGATTKAMKAAGESPLKIGLTAAAIMEAEYVANVPAVLQTSVRTLVLMLGATKTENLLHNEYNSWVPYGFDENRAVKYTWSPCANEASTEAVTDDASVLGARLKRDLATKKGQRCFDLTARFHYWWMPSVENPALAWVGLNFFGTNTDVRLGRLVLGSHTTDPDFCETLSFNPGHAPGFQRGVGSTQRARRLIYAAVETRRNENRGRKEVK